MNDNEKQSPLFALVEMLYIPMSFYVLLQFDKIDSPLKGALWLVIFALVQNEYHSIKQSSPKYNLWLYLSDIMSLFVYLFALKAIFKLQAILGYDPKFWIYLSFLWLSYGIWDWIMVYHEKDPQKRPQWRRWRNGMLVCFGITFLCGCALFNMVNIPISPPIKFISNILHILLFSCVAWSLGGWWLREYFFNKSLVEQAAGSPDVV